MNNIVKGVLIIVIVLVAGGIIIFPKIDLGSEELPQEQSRGVSEIPVHVDIIEPEKIENIIRITGSILPNESIRVISEISGKIEGIYFREGQHVKKGDLLVSINDDEIAAQIERLKYQQKLNEDNEYRQRQLLEREAISREEYDIALTTLNTILAEIKEREARLDKHHIRASFSGIVGLRQVSEGSYISPPDLICNLYNINPVKIEFGIPERYSLQVNEGDSISFTIEGVSRIFDGIVYATEPRIDPATRTLQIRALSPNPDDLMLPGQFAKIQYTLNVIPDALMVPSEAVIPELNGHKIFVYNGGKVAQRNVNIGIRTENKVQVVSGIEPSDTVITTGILQIRPGVQVSIKEIN